MALFPQPFIDDLRLQANIVQVVQEYVPLKRAGRATRGCVRFTARRRRRSTSIPTRGSSTASAAASAAMSSSFSSCTRRSAFRTRCGCSRTKFGVSLPELDEGADEDSGAIRRSRSAAESARGGRGLFPRAARGAGRRPRAGSSSRSVRSTRTTIERLGLGLRAAHAATT